jgi:hypothetical protein
MRILAIRAPQKSSSLPLEKWRYTRQISVRNPKVVARDPYRKGAPHVLAKDTLEGVAHRWALETQSLKTASGRQWMPRRRS